MVVNGEDYSNNLSGLWRGFNGMVRVTFECSAPPPYELEPNLVTGPMYNRGYIVNVTLLENSEVSTSGCFLPIVPERPVNILLYDWSALERRGHLFNMEYYGVYSKYLKRKYPDKYMAFVL